MSLDKAFGKYSYIVPEESSFAFQFQEYTIYKRFSKIMIRIMVIVIITTARMIIILLSQIFATPKALYNYYLKFRHGKNDENTKTYSHLDIGYQVKYFIF